MAKPDEELKQQVKQLILQYVNKYIKPEHEQLKKEAMQRWQEQEEFNHQLQELPPQLTEINQRLAAVEDDLRNYLTPPPPEESPLEEFQEEPILDEPSEYIPPPPVYREPLPWVNDYNWCMGNGTIASFSQNFEVISVSPTEESWSRHRSNPDEPIDFHRDNYGNYWLVNYDTYLYLVPSDNLTINQFSYKSLKVLFECHDYQPNNSEEFRVQEPAIVITLSDGKTWQLQQKGILRF